MRIVLLHDEPGDEAAVEQHDVLVQRDTVAAALNRLGHQPLLLGCTLDLDSVRRRLLNRGPDVVFNLVESLGGTDRLMPLAALLLDALAIPYTGAPSGAMLATSNKLAAKKLLCEAGLPTPEWTAGFHSAEEAVVCGDHHHAANGGRWILKPIWEHASFQMHDDAVIPACEHAALLAGLTARERRFGRPHFAERFIDGREFNLSLLAGQLLAPAEIDFSSFPPEKPRIVGHRAKWEPDSLEYQRTPRRFDFPAGDAPLLEHLGCLARACWKLFGLSGYARVDVRVDRGGRPWILEVNANPCLSPNAGFAAALARTGIGYDDAVQRMIDDADRSLTLHVEPSPAQSGEPRYPSPLWT